MAFKTSTITHAILATGGSSGAKSSFMGVGDYINGGLGGGMGLVVSSTSSGTATKTVSGGTAIAKATGVSSGVDRLV
jgi:hypothetical protein